MIRNYLAYPIKNNIPLIKNVVKEQHYKNWCDQNYDKISREEIIKFEQNEDQPEHKEDKRKKSEPVLSDKSVFLMLESCGWCESDEKVLTNINISLPSLYKLYPHMVKLMKSLDTVVGPLNTQFTLKEKKNFLAHLLTKGEQFYNYMFETPDICLPFMDKYQPFYDIMMKQIKIADIY
jgi:hypothetical protein